MPPHAVCLGKGLLKIVLKIFVKNSFIDLEESDNWPEILFLISISLQANGKII